MKYIAIADLHLSSTGEKHGNELNLSEQLFSIMNVLTNIVDYAKKHNINKIIILGDIIDTKSIIHTVAQSSLLDFIRQNQDIHFYVIDGNHDMSEKSKYAVSALKCLDSEVNVTTFHKEGVIDNMFFVPWRSDMIDTIKSNSYDYLFSHFGLNEGQLSSGISIISDIKLRDLNRYKHVILGHYHKPQELGNVIYVGSLIQLSWNEKNEEKRFLVIDNEEDTVESIPSVGYRKYIEYHLTEENRDDTIIKARHEKKDGNFVRITRDEIIDVDDISNDFVIIDKFERDVTNRGLTLSMDSKEKFNRYMEIKNIPQDEKEEYLIEAIDIANTVVVESD
jgi:DNA repair exonuclease SbcCD nuclease subunit